MINIYLTVDAASATDEFVSACVDPDDPGKLEALLEGPVTKTLGEPSGSMVPCVVSHRVSNAIRPPLVRGEDKKIRPVSGGVDAPKTLIVPLRIDDSKAQVTVNEETLKALCAATEGARNACADLAFQTAYASAPDWCRGTGLGRGFGARTEAFKVIGRDFLTANGLDGSGVNVVIVDHGLDANQLAGNFFGGWVVGSKVAGQLQYVRGVTGNYHGMLIARNVLAVAPQARLFDCPLIPDRIENVEIFLSMAESVLDWVRLWIGFWREVGPFKGPWVVVNAWAIFDRSTEMPPGNYSESSAHSFNQLMRRFAEDNIDVVFAAGNCGQFCPDRRCRPYDTGPGASIYGAHAHASVLTVGAVRADGLWAGSSSQGPSPVDQAAPSPEITRLKPQKPDLCAPSFFTETSDAHAFNGGTSTASALAAGVVAALRGAAGFEQIPTDSFFDALRQSANRAGAPLWDGRLGFGMIDAESAFNRLQAL